jgi:hypothetical protein
MTPHVAFFGDGDHSFCLTAALVIELERKTGSGIGALCTRIFNRQFTQSDLQETIRCALVGAGTDPKRAAELIAAYAVDRPISEIYPIAVAVLEALWLGFPNEELNGPT